MLGVVSVDVATLSLAVHARGRSLPNMGLPASAPPSMPTSATESHVTARRRLLVHIVPRRPLSLCRDLYCHLAGRGG